jgi:hypothetical protein
MVMRDLAASDGISQSVHARVHFASDKRPLPAQKFLDLLQRNLGSGLDMRFILQAAV